MNDALNRLAIVECALCEVIRHLRGEEPDGQTVEPGTCAECGYTGPLRDASHGCVGCMECPEGPPQVHEPQCRLCEPICPVCDNGLIVNPEAGRWARALMAAEGALAVLVEGGVPHG
jgi:hypothetical protein